jgi:transposase
LKRYHRCAANAAAPGAALCDRSYDHDEYRRLVWALGVKPKIARRATGHGSGLGAQRRVVKRTFAHLHWFRRSRIRREIRDDIHEAFLTRSCALMCWRRLQSLR